MRTGWGGALATGVLLLAHSARATAPDALVETPRRAPERAGSAIPATEILHADTLQRRGAVSLAEALVVIPGVQVVALPDGRKLVVLDGLTGRALLTVDGLPLVAGPQGELDFGELPSSLDEVDHVEIIRQPMGHVHGSGAAGGVINVVTRRVGSTGVQATLVGFGAQHGGVGARGSAHASVLGEKGGAYVRTSGLASFPGGDRRGASLATGGAFHVHRRVLVRGDVDLRESDTGAGLRGPDVQRRTMAAAEAVIALWELDTLRVLIRAGSLGRGWRDASAVGRWQVGEQGVSIRYLGEPISGHSVHLELGGVVELALVDGTASAARMRVSSMFADTWRVGERFAVEAALRLESSERLQPVAAPAVALRYEPFEHIILRAGVASGYRYGGLVPDAAVATLPAWAATGTDASAEAGRGMRLELQYAPSELVRAVVSLFRTDFSGRPMTLKADPLVTTVLTPPLPGAPTAHVQGLRTEMALGQLPAGMNVRVGYVYLDQARDDRRDVTLPFAPVHSGTMAVSWQNLRWRSGVEVAGEAAVERRRMDDTAWRPTAQLNLAVWQGVGPLEVAVVMHNATSLRDAELGPRDGRGVRLVLRADPGRQR